MTHKIDINDTALNLGWSILAVIVITPPETDYFFGDVPPSLRRLKNYILIYKRNP